LRWITNLSGTAWPAGEAPDAGYWRRQAREAVQFGAGIGTLWEQGYEVYVEVGPRPTLVGLGAACVPAGAGTWLASLRPGRDDWEQLLETVGALYARGVPIDWAGFDRDYPRRRVALPTYPFQRQRYWFTDAPSLRPARPARPAPGEHPLLGRRLRSPLAAVQFESEVSPSGLAFLADHRVFGTAIMPAAAFVEMGLAAAAKVFGSDERVLRDLVIGQALAFRDGAPRTVQLVVEPESDGAAR